MLSLWPNRRASSGLPMRRLVHSPSWAIRITVVSVTVVRGSMSASTPRRGATNSCRCAISAWLAARQPPPAAFRRRRNSATDDPPPRLPPRRAGWARVRRKSVTLGTSFHRGRHKVTRWRRIVMGTSPGALQAPPGSTRERPECRLRRRHPRGRQRRLRRRAARRTAGPVRRSDREGQGRRHLPAPRLHPHQGAAARRRGRRRRARGRAVRRAGHLQRHRHEGRQHVQGRCGRAPLQGPAGTDQVPQDHVRRG